MKPVVVGLDNPHSSDPQMALHPSAFPGSAGSRLFRMVREAVPDMSESEYVEGLDRVNVVDLEGFVDVTAAQVFAERYRDRDVVVLGYLVAHNLGLGKRGGFHQWGHSLTFRHVVVPHPSGRNLVYNDREERLKTGLLVGGLIRGQ